MHSYCGSVAINSIKQALHLAVGAAEYYDVVGIGEVRHMDVSSNLNPWVILQSLAKNPADYVIEEGRGESTSLSNTGADFKSIESLPLALTFILVDG